MLLVRGDAGNISGIQTFRRPDAHLVRGVYHVKLCFFYHAACGGLFRFWALHAFRLFGGLRFLDQLDLYGL